MLGKAFKIVADNGEMLLDEEFMMGMLDPPEEQLTSFREYCDYMFEQKQSNSQQSRKAEDKVLPWDILHAKLFYPTCSDIRDVICFDPSFYMHFSH